MAIGKRGARCATTSNRIKRWNFSLDLSQGTTGGDHGPNHCNSTEFLSYGYFPTVIRIWCSLGISSKSGVLIFPFHYRAVRWLLWWGLSPYEVLSVKLSFKRFHPVCLIPARRPATPPLMSTCRPPLKSVPSFCPSRAGSGWQFSCLCSSASFPPGSGGPFDTLQEPMLNNPARTLPARPDHSSRVPDPIKTR